MVQKGDEKKKTGEGKRKRGKRKSQRTSSIQTVFMMMNRLSKNLLLPRNLLKLLFFSFFLLLILDSTVLYNYISSAIASNFVIIYCFGFVLSN